MAFKVGDKVKQTERSPYRGRIPDDAILEVEFIFKVAEGLWTCPFNCKFQGQDYPFKANELELVEANSPSEGTLT